MNRFSVLCLTFAFLAVNPAYAVCVKASEAVVRSGPGRWYEKLWEVYKYTPLQKVGTSLSGDWLAVKDLDGDVVWIEKRHTTNGYNCAIVRTDKVNIRTGPGTSNALISSSPAIHYDSFKILQEKGGWLKVANERGDAGWIDKSYLWTQ